MRRTAGYDKTRRARWLLVAMVAGGCCAPGQAASRPLGHATLLEAENDVRYKAADAAERPAKTRDIVRGTDQLRTGQKSLAELQFEDQTITRLGSNSLFTFDPERREFSLRDGVLLFDMPKGIGGGRIRTAGFTAAIEGTAGIVTQRAAGQAICLAGLIRILGARGQLLALLRPGDTFRGGRVMQVDLRGLLKGKMLRCKLPHSQKELDDAIARQAALINAGALVAAGQEETEPGLNAARSPDQPFRSGIEALRNADRKPPASSEPRLPR